MQEAIHNLQSSFNTIIDALEMHKEVAEIDLTELDEYIRDMSVLHPELKANFEKFKETVIAYKTNDSKFLEEVNQIKTILLSFHNQLDSLNQTLNSEPLVNKFGAKRRSPNPDFIKLVEQGLISPHQKIFTSVNNNIVTGNFSEDGYFNILGQSQMFSSLTTALSFIHCKQMRNGWDNWFAMDENGITSPINHYRELLK